jgi:hypothetical protein
MPAAPRIPDLDKLIPQPLKAEVQVKVQMPDEVLQLARDLHDDRQTLGAMLWWGLILFTFLTFRYLFRRTT